MSIDFYVFSFNNTIFFLWVQYRGMMFDIRLVVELLELGFVDELWPKLSDEAVNRNSWKLGNNSTYRLKFSMITIIYLIPLHVDNEPIVSMEILSISFSVESINHEVCIAMFLASNFCGTAPYELSDVIL